MIDANFFYKKIDDSLLEGVLEKICSLLSGYELSSFMLACSFPAGLSEEGLKELRKNFQFRLIQKMRESRSLTVDCNNPDALITLDFNRLSIRIALKPIYILGQYLKYSRKISQTTYFCPACRGRGCQKCSYRKTLPYESVQDLIAKEAMPFFEAKEDFFHGAGREDLDVRMLGAGRPFVLELSDPKKRNLDLKELGRKINSRNEGKIMVQDLEYCGKEKIAQVKEEQHWKEYSFLMRHEGGIGSDALKKLEDNLGKEITVFQRTPERVSKRRSDLVRRRKATILEISGTPDNQARVVLLAEHGLYIKEFVSSDNERTKPSLSSIAGTALECRELDVTGIRN